jgi:hypothetical protein
MGMLFDNLCKGPVVVVDDRIGDKNDLINKLIADLKNNHLPVLPYTSPLEIKNELPGLLFSNFIVLDWRFTEGGESTIGIVTGDEAETLAEKEVIELIKELKKVCLAPIFIFSTYDRDWIISRLESAGIWEEEKEWIFIENKEAVCKTIDRLISKIEEWIEESPHIYLAKWLTNELLLNNTAVFWRLYESNPRWPILFYNSFAQEQDPILALRDTLCQLIFSEVNISNIETSLLTREVKEKNAKKQKKSLRDLYRKLVYIEKDIDKDICPGDVFHQNDIYYLNIRPECDTTRRTSNPEIYLLKGYVRDPKEVKENSYYEDYGIIDKEPEITMPLLDGHPFVVFKKRDLFIRKYSEMKDYKICRVALPFITRIRQSYSSYIGRFGLPSYPEEIIKSLFESIGDSP